jgi:hypothetical protein
MNRAASRTSRQLLALCLGACAWLIDYNVLQTSVGVGVTLLGW